jgi:type 1 glutamine amidotransferase
LGGLDVYETAPPTLPQDLGRPAILVFSKTNGFRHDEAIAAGNVYFSQFAAAKGWGYFATENGAAFNPEILSRFDVVVFNNTSGDVFLPAQKAAFRAFVEGGGGFVGLHAAGDNSHEGWPWYQTQLIGAKFTQHTVFPQFQQATVRLDDTAHPLSRGLPSKWQRTDEWYSFEKSPRAQGVTVIATIDESSYKPEGLLGADLRMGDHPVAWARTLGHGRVFYTAVGHLPEAFSERETRRLLDNALIWANGYGREECKIRPCRAEGVVP